MPVKKLIRMAALTAAALIIFIIEAQIPAPVPIPGIKLGFANIITLYALFQGRGADSFRISDVFLILLCRIILGAVFTGRIVAFIYSAAGGFFCFAAMAVLRRFLPDSQIWVCGIIGAVFHNTGQITAAIFVMGTVAVTAYLPFLIAAGIITGLFTGIITQLVFVRLKNLE